jgi:hypothetical protein
MTEKFLSEELEEMMLLELMINGIIKWQFEFQLFEIMIVKILIKNNMKV